MCLEIQRTWTFKVSEWMMWGGQKNISYVLNPHNIFHLSSTQLTFSRHLPSYPNTPFILTTSSLVYLPELKSFIMPSNTPICLPSPVLYPHFVPPPVTTSTPPPLTYTHYYTPTPPAVPPAALTYPHLSSPTPTCLPPAAPCRRGREQERRIRIRPQGEVPLPPPALAR